MPGDPYFERIWAAVPEGAEPEHFALRRGFLLENVSAGERVLDLGCGEGDFSAALAEHGALPVAVEVAAEALRRAAAREPALELRLVGSDGALPFRDATFDAVWAGELLEHVRDCAGLLDECHRVLRAGGRLLVSTPNHPPLRLLRLALSPRAFDAHFEPRADHLRFFSSRTLRALLEVTGFDHVAVRTAGGLPGARPLLLATARRPGAPRGVTPA